LDGESVSSIDRLNAEQVQELGEALLDFAAPADLKTWLDDLGEQTIADGGP
jgi:hypothetical protein